MIHISNELLASESCIGVFHGDKGSRKSLIIKQIDKFSYTGEFRWGPTVVMMTRLAHA